MTLELEEKFVVVNIEAIGVVTECTKPSRAVPFSIAHQAKAWHHGSMRGMICTFVTDDTSNVFTPSITEAFRTLCKMGLDHSEHRLSTLKVAGDVPSLKTFFAGRRLGTAHHSWRN